MIDPTLSAHREKSIQKPRTVHNKIILLIFLLDRISKLYLLNLQESGVEVNFYISPFLNFFLIWNTGIGFGLFSFEADIYYQLTTTFIGIINLLIVYLIFNLKDIDKNHINNSILEAEKELSKDEIDDQKRFLLNHKVEVLKSLSIN